MEFHYRISIVVKELCSYACDVISHGGEWRFIKTVHIARVPQKPRYKYAGQTNVDCDVHKKLILILPRPGSVAVGVGHRLGQTLLLQ